MFEEHVIESARANSNIAGLYYNNAIECMHYLEKFEQCFKRGSLETVLTNLKPLIDRQYSEEIRAIYGAGSYSLSSKYAKFRVDNAKWHSWSQERKLQHINAFRNYQPTLSDDFDKPNKAGRKPNQIPRKHSRQPEMIIDRLEKDNNAQINNGSTEKKLN